MIKSIFILFLVYISLLSYSQETSNEHFFPNDEGWLLDSVFHTCTLYGDQALFRTLERNESGFPLKYERLNFNFTTNEYDVVYSSTYFYPNEYDSTIFFRTVLYDDDSVQYFTNYNDTGYMVESNERWQFGDIWTDGRMKKRNINYSDPCYHDLDYIKFNETDEWLLCEENKAVFNSDSTILFEYSYSGRESIMDTTKKSLTYYNDNNLPYDYNWFKKVDGEWELRKSTETTYDENNHVICILKYRNYSGELRFDDKKTYEYDEKGFLSSYQRFNWDRIANFWKYYDRNDYINDSFGNVLTEIEFRYISDTAWGVRRKIENIYNDEGKRIQKESFYLDSDSTWKKSWLINYTHHSDRYYSYEKLKWDTSLNLYRNSSKTERILDENDRLIESKFYDSEDPDFSWYLKKTYSNLYLEGDYQFIKKEIYYNHIVEDTTELNIKYYNKKNTGLFEFIPNNFSLFPNPSTDVIYVRSEIYNSQNLKYEIYNITGQLIKFGSTNSRGTISIQQLTHGMYLLKVYKPNNKTEVLKFQKQRVK